MSAAEEQKELDLSRVNQAVMVKYLAIAELSTEGTLEELAARLQQQQQTLPNDQLADCNDCFGVSDLRAPECVFCGAGGMELPDGTRVEPPPQPAAAKPAPAAKAPAPAPSRPANQPPPPPPPEAAAGNVTNIRKAGKASPATTKAKPSQASTELDAYSKKGEAALDKRIKAFEAIQKKQVVNYYELVVEMKGIFDERLWTQRLGEDGKQKYKGWNQFVVAELGVEANYSYALMDIVKSYTIEQFEAVGIKKLRLILQLPKELRGEMADRAAQENLPFSQVSEEVKRLAGPRRGPEETGRTGFGSGGAGGSSGTRKGKGKSGTGRKRKGVAAAVPELKKGELTAVLTMGRQKLPLFARSKKKGDEPRRALKITDEPWAELSLPGGVVQYFRLVQDAKGLAIQVETRRQEED